MFYKKAVLKISQYSQESNCVGVSFIKVAGPRTCSCIEKRLHQFFSRAYCENLSVWKTSVNGCFSLFIYFSNLFVFRSFFTVMKKNYDLFWWRKCLLKLDHVIQWRNFKGHAKIVEIYMVQFNVSILSRLKTMGFFL